MDQKFFNSICRRKSNKKRPYQKWSSFEQLAYRQFLALNAKMFDDEKQRKSKMIWCLLQKHVKTKTNTQCKSHHQKMLLRYHTIENIIRNEELDKKQKVLQNKQKSRQGQEKQQIVVLSSESEQQQINYLQESLYKSENSLMPLQKQQLSIENRQDEKSRYLFDQEYQQLY